MEINVCFTDEEFDEILKYQKIFGTETVQSAIMNAVRNALDNEALEYVMSAMGGTDAESK